VGLEYFVVVAPSDASFRGSLKGGKALALAELLLADIARRSGVRPLSAFLSGDPEMIAGELAEFEQDTGITVPPDAKSAVEQWFTPGEGVAAVQSLLECARKDAEGVPLVVELALSELVQVLESARRLGLQWHLDLA